MFGDDVMATAPLVRVPAPLIRGGTTLAGFKPRADDSRSRGGEDKAMVSTEVREQVASERSVVLPGTPSRNHDDGRPLRPLARMRPTTAVVISVIGVLTALGAAVALFHEQPRSTPSRPSPPLWRLTDASTVRTWGPVDLAVQTIAYAPGQSSGWHAHPGLHLVSVVSGTLTVYGPDCQAVHYGPGQPYVGGDALHLARNEGDVPVQMGVTWLTKPGQAMADFRTARAAPSGCPVE